MKTFKIKSQYFNINLIKKFLESKNMKEGNKNIDFFYVDGKYQYTSHIRKILKKYQIKFSKKFKNCCIEGRDISTKILPNSDLKFFFVCNINTAALRRYKELKKTSKKIKLNDVKQALRVRNRLDKQRKISPLLKHRNSIIVNSQKLNKKEMVEKMSKHIEKVINI